MKQFSTVTQRLVDCGVVAVIRGATAETSLELAKAAAKGGIVALEITFTVPGAEDVIRQLKQECDGSYMVGAGIILTPEDCEKAVACGAEFIVAPNFDERVCAVCKEKGVPYYPGVFTVTEIINAMQHGVEACKLFPGSLARPPYIKAIHGPLPEVNIMPTGGVDLFNVEAWIHAGAVAISVGTCLTNVARDGNYEEMSALAKQYVEKVRAARNSK